MAARCRGAWQGLAIWQGLARWEVSQAQAATALTALVVLQSLVAQAPWLLLPSLALWVLLLGARPLLAMQQAQSLPEPLLGLQQQWHHVALLLP